MPSEHADCVSKTSAQKILVACFLSLSGSLTFAQSAIVRVFADQKNEVHVLRRDGQGTVIAAEPQQVGIDSVKISKDGQTAGWLVLYPDPDSTTPFAGTLILWRGGKVVHRFKTDQTFWSWNFYAHAIQVAYHAGATHGAAPHCELHEIESGRLVASWDGDLESANRPTWTKVLDH